MFAYILFTIALVATIIIIVIVAKQSDTTEAVIFSAICILVFGFVSMLINDNVNIKVSDTVGTIATVVDKYSVQKRVEKRFITKYYLVVSVENGETIKKEVNAKTFSNVKVNEVKECDMVYYITSLTKTEKVNYVINWS